VIDAGAIKRENIFVTSKVWLSDVEDVEAACRKSLNNLGLEYLDLYLVHWPVATKPIPGTDQWERINIPMHKVWE